ncbi:hypothetical protein [Rhodobacter ferrooxidans]|uniref:Uncharacterized protein n=1 Tax=Rhodobacter ferrooxidans TaxID=371731 RepID=C8RXR5_9RHOB|nr:hypothetical protein [Rhodobacter sp. SW2]EEW26313.1 conserved hypothetical protein [Rhodobacter sp. SW2]
MRFTPLVTLLAAAIAISFWLPWLALPTGQGFTPNDLLGQMTGAEGKDGYSLLLSFLATFALAGFLALVALFGLAPRVLALLTGAAPLGVIGYVANGAMTKAQTYGLPLPTTGDWQAILKAVQPYIEPGLYVYVGAAAVLVVLSLIDPGSRRG